MSKVNALWHERLIKIEHDFCDGLISEDYARSAMAALRCDPDYIDGTIEAIRESNEAGDGDQFGMGA